VALCALAAGAVAFTAARAATFERREGPIVFVVPDGSERTFEVLGPRAPAIVAEVSRALGAGPAAPFRMVLLPANGLRDTALARFDHGAPAWAAGYMEPRSRTGAIRLGQASRYPYGTPEAVLAHESAHQVLHDLHGEPLPLWFEEGVCTWVARDWQLEDVLQLSSRLITHSLPSLDALDQRFRGPPDQVDQAYAASFAFVSWSVARYGPAFVRDVLGETRTHGFERAWLLAAGERLDRAEAAWRRESLFRYRWLPILAGSGTLWFAVMFIAFLVWVRRRRRARLLEAEWARDETYDPAATEEWMHPDRNEDPNAMSAVAHEPPPEMPTPRPVPVEPQPTGPSVPPLPGGPETPPPQADPIAPQPTGPSVPPAPTGPEVPPVRGATIEWRPVAPGAPPGGAAPPAWRRLDGRDEGDPSG